MNHKYSKSDDDRHTMLSGFKYELVQIESSLPYSISSLGRLHQNFLLLKHVK